MAERAEKKAQRAAAKAARAASPKKRRPKPKPVVCTIAYVRWQDAAYQAGEQTVSEMVRYVELHSAGLLVREDDQTLTLAIDHFPGDQTYRRILHIPVCNITHLEKFHIR